MRDRPVTTILTALILLMFAWQVKLAFAAHETPLHVFFAPSEEVLRHSGAAYTGMPLTTGWWRLIASMFVHGGLIHLAANVLALVQLGYLLEALFGPLAATLSFSIGGVAAGLFAMLIPGSPRGVVYVGASGAIFAIAGTLLVGLRTVTRVHGATWSHRLSSRLVGCLAANLILGLAISAIATWADLGFEIANSAHVGGLAAGLLIGLLLPLQLRDSPLTRRLGG
ncbi:MAG TPA: rhomboid family intramembrane serine protease [Thermoanaerobaculia bacterium]|nr:rhomboid family intramembrane serine protease [Thermoanaerobaculia bacterium]